MTLGFADRQGGLFDGVNPFCERVLGGRSMYAVLPGSVTGGFRRDVR
ncbi:MAG: hypothetical protein ACRDZO_25550 [Egibacteraceae bacterium]